MIGVYIIKNILDSKIYIGSTISWKKRKYTHISKLDRGIHPNKHLQSAWNKYGKENFIFEIVEEVKDEFWLRPREQAWINRFNSCDNHIGYNRSELVFNTKLPKEEHLRIHNTDKAKKNHSEAAKRWQSDPIYKDSLLSKRIEHSQKLLGRKQTDDTRDKRRESMIATLDKKTGLTQEQRLDKK